MNNVPMVLPDIAATLLKSIVKNKRPRLYAIAAALGIGSNKQNHASIKIVGATIYNQYPPLLFAPPNWAITINSRNYPMRIKQSLLALVIATTSFAAQAAEPGFVLGAHVGKPMVDVDIDRASVSAGRLLGFSAGYDFGNTFSLELDIAKASGDLKAPKLFNGYYGNYTAEARTDYDIDTTALYGVFRTEGKGYFLAKLGLLTRESIHWWRIGKR
ncbi:MAG: outer membrane beta-barrel protein [Marinagarivorans sp.]|nr:outer membrane beta-barrel protein [Marinagarivorans sp.]